MDFTCITDIHLGRSGRRVGDHWEPDRRNGDVCVFYCVYCKYLIK